MQSRFQRTILNSFWHIEMTIERVVMQFFICFPKHLGKTTSNTCISTVYAHTNHLIAKYIYACVWKFWNYERKVMMQQDIKEVVCATGYLHLTTWLIYEWGHPVILLLQLYLFSTTYTQQFHAPGNQPASSQLSSCIGHQLFSKIFVIGLHNRKFVASKCSPHLYLMAPRSMIACLCHKIILK